MKALIALSLLGVVVLFAEIFKFKRFLFPAVIVGLLGVIGLLITEWGFGNVYFRMINIDTYSIIFFIIILSIAILWFLFSKKYFDSKSNITDYYGLVIFSLVGAMLLTSFNNMVMLFLGVEILSIPVYVLAGSNKADAGSNESAMKYFLMGAFATGLLLFGIAMIYGVSGSFYLNDIAKGVMANKAVAPGLLQTGIIFLLAGLSFKVAAAPMHFWAPDVYKGAPTVVTAYMATVVKAAAFAAFFRLFATCFNGIHSEWSTTVWTFSLLSIIVSNITAVFQTNAKRMLAYSGISHAGFMLIAVLCMSTLSTKAIIYYSAAYAVASIAAFAVLLKVSEAKGSDEIVAFEGLAKKNPMLAIVMTIALLSMAGIPPMAGFFAKYYIFTNALASGYTGLVIIAILGSLVGVYYYFKIIIAMFAGKEKGAEINLDLLTKLVLIISAGITLALGLFPDLLLNVLRF